MEIYTLSETAGILKVSIKTLRRGIVSGRFTPGRIGRQFRVTPQDIQHYLTGNGNGNGKKHRARKAIRLDTEPKTSKPIPVVLPAPPIKTLADYDADLDRLRSKYLGPAKRTGRKHTA